MSATTVATTVEEFLSRQRAMYAGGDVDAVVEMLADCVVWHVPGTSPIAGDHIGRDAVLACTCGGGESSPVVTCRW